MLTPTAIARLACTLLALAGCHHAATSGSGVAPARLTDVERMAVGAALAHVVSSAPVQGRPICLGPGYGARDSVAMGYFAAVVSATRAPAPGEVANLACGGAWRTPGATDSTAIALRVRRVVAHGMKFDVWLGAWDSESILTGITVRLELDFDEFRVISSRPVYQ